VETCQAPGEWAGKEGKYVPKLELDAASGRYTVTVAHGMDAAHYVQYI